MGIIYCATNVLNGKKYIGFSRKTIEKRSSEHLCAARKEKPPFLFHQELKKWEPINFRWEILWEGLVRVEILAKLEIHFIQIENSKYPNGYNLTIGGQCGLEMPQETKDKIGVGSKNRPQEVFTKMANFHRGKKRSVETKAKMRAAQLGKKHSPETRAKMSAIQRARRQPEN